MNNLILFEKLKEWLAPYVFNLWIWLSKYENQDEMFNVWCPIIQRQKKEKRNPLNKEPKK